MTEAESLNTSNLVKIRSATRLIADCLFMSGKAEDERVEVIRTLCRWETSLLLATRDVEASDEMDYAL